MCTWESINPGNIIFPETSIIFSAEIGIFFIETILPSSTPILHMIFPGTILQFDKQRSNIFTPDNFIFYMIFLSFDS